MYPVVTRVSAETDYILRIGFEDGTEGRIDMKPLLDFGVFNRLKDPAAFRQVKIVFDTVEWDCGVDIDPEYLHANCKSV